MVYDVRLRAYEPGGSAIGFLPEPLKLDVSFVHNDTGALSIEYSRAAAGGDILGRGLEQGLEVAVEVSNGGTWVEPRGGRFVLVSRDHDQADVGDVVRLTLPSYSWLLMKARNLNTASLLPEGDEQAGKRPFYSKPAGVIMRTLLDENAARGGVPVARGWTDAADTAGAAWSQAATLYYELGDGLDVILSSLADQGMCDWRTNGRTLQMWNADSPALSRALDATVRLWLGTDVQDAPSAESIEEIVSRALLRGDGGLVVTVDNPSAPTPWGEWEGYVSQGGVTDEITARKLVQSDLQRASRVRGQYTRALVLAGDVAHAPLIDYWPGDWIMAPTTGTGEKVRVQQVTISKGSDGVTGSVVLHDRVMAAELRAARKMQGITGGAAAGGSGRPTNDDTVDGGQNPPAPSAPGLFSKLGTVTVSWDGKTVGGNPMPGNVVRVDVYQDGELVAALYSGDTSVPIVGLPVVSTAFYLKAVDDRGRESVASTSSVIVPHRIEGPDIEANSVTTNELAAGSVTTEVLEATAIDGMTITGATIRTAASGDRVQMSGTSLRSIEDSVTRVTIDPSGVTVPATGRLRALHSDGSSAAWFGPVYAIATGTLFGRGLLVQKDNAGADAGNDIFQAIFRTDATTVVKAGQGTTSRVGEFAAYANNVYLCGTGADGVTLQSLTTDGTGVRTQLGMNNDRARLSMWSTAGDSYGSLGVDSGGPHIYGAGTTSASANVVLDGGYVKMTSSSLRYKQDVERLDMDDVDTATILDALAPRTWRDRTDVAEDPDTTRRFVGTIAEDMHDAGLGQWVGYDDQGRPDNLSYDRLTNLLAVVVQRQQEQLTALAARVAALEAAAG
ncbi:MULTISPECIES: tail fiber domain-containing protein [unclassified Isoptericola]|uniref:hypothetical protein n=1 Tax=unclassified Isoptericola TaxID=2623355 RepID=UPI00365E49DA